MRKTYINRFKNNIDFNIVQYGMENCRRSYSIGNFVRKNYLLHYVYDGCGIFKANGKTHHIVPGQAFLIFPEDVTFYQADEKNPWTYCWIEFYGSMVNSLLVQAGLSRENPIFTEGPPYIAGQALKQIISIGEMPPYQLTGMFWIFAGHLIKNMQKEKDERREYIDKALNYIHTFHWRKITVSEVADYVGINRSYFTRLFCEYVKMPPKKYIYSHRIKIAEQLLSNPQLSVKNVALSVGYDDQMNFSKAFRRTYGISPSEWRKRKA